MVIYEKYLTHNDMSIQKPSLFYLEKIYETFTRIPYENASKIISKHARKDRLRFPEELFSQHITAGTGGTCFSLVYALFKLLQFIQIQSYLVFADRSYGENTHTAVMAIVENRMYLLDPGYLIPKPVLVPASGESRTVVMPMNDLRLDNFGETIKVSTIRNGNETVRYVIKNKEVMEKDFLNTWESSFEMKMMDKLCMTRLTPNSQIYLRENRVEIITREKREKYYIEDNYSRKVNNLFGISQAVIEELLSWHNLKI